MYCIFGITNNTTSVVEWLKYSITNPEVAGPISEPKMKDNHLESKCASLEFGLVVSTTHS